jgi:ABC-type dipeptide/oligopeptide/nickel transport system ATPase component
MKIKPQKDTSIIEEISLELGNYTILAGENDSGKTNLIRAIKNHEDLKTFKPIFVPAEHIQPQNEETKSSAATTEFSKLVKTILGPIFTKDILKDLVKKFNESEVKKNFVNDINRYLVEFGVKKKKFDVKISEDKFNEDLVIKIIKAFVKDLYKTEVDEVDFEKIGMGTQRLIVAALIRYYEEKKIGENEEVLIIFEEPEVYLHPKWKKGLYNSLLRLSEREKTKVIITTHDPYFIELGKNQKIYQVFRDPDKKDITAIKEMPSGELLPFKSDSEINYLVFDIPSKAYFLEIYEYSKHKAGYDYPKSYVGFDNHMFYTHFQVKGKVQDCIDDISGKPIMPVTRLRHDIAHGKDTAIDLKDLKEATKDMTDFLKSIL